MEKKVLLIEQNSLVQDFKDESRLQFIEFMTGVQESKIAILMKSLPWSLLVNISSYFKKIKEA